MIIFEIIKIELLIAHFLLVLYLFFH